MTNQERAAEIILGRTATDAAQALAEAGLLMPEDMETQFGVEILVNGEWDQHVDMMSNEVWDSDKKFAEDTLDYFIGTGLSLIHI